MQTLKQIHDIDFHEVARLIKNDPEELSSLHIVVIYAQYTMTAFTKSMMFAVSGLKPDPDPNNCLESV